MAAKSTPAPAAPAAPKIERPRIELNPVVVGADEDEIPEAVGPGRRSDPAYLEILAAVKEAAKYPSSTFSVQNVENEKQADKVIRFLRKAGDEDGVKVKLRTYFNPEKNKVLFQVTGAK